jgi:hypothetical protein
VADAAAAGGSRHEPTTLDVTADDDRERMTILRCGEGHEVKIKSRILELADVPIWCFECGQAMRPVS